MPVTAPAAVAGFGWLFRRDSGGG
ncbi:MAG: hypothetical protein LBS12_02960 [Prevotellaceae bacterium]|nr:hypothetical protein [Prevotellaceae bacterium]